MRMKTIFTILTLAVFAGFSQASAQELSRDLERLSQINRINPLQNRDFDTSDEILKRDIQDRKNKIIGTVKEVTVNKNGSIEFITAEFDRLRLSNDVPLNYRGLAIRTKGDSYALNFEDDEVESLYPQLLANIDTAAGEAGDSYPISRIVGAQLITDEGRRVGHVRQVLFGSNGGRADALFVELSSGKSRGDTAAIPFRAVSFEEKSGRLQAVISKELNQALAEVADRNRY